MAIPIKYLADLLPNETYHIYNRTNNKEKLFINDQDCIIFLKSFRKMLLPFLGIYSYNLLPNHFHFLVKLNPENVVRQYLRKRKKLRNFEKKYLARKINYAELIEHQFKNFFISYALGFNKRHSRKGNLFHRPFKRLKIESDSHFTEALVYINANAVKHKIEPQFGNYQWSSWNHLWKEDCWLMKKELIDWFGSEKLLVDAHHSLSSYYYETEAAIEY